MTTDATALPFAAPCLQDAPTVRELTRFCRTSDLSFANIYLLSEKYGTTIAARNGALFRHFAGNGRLQGYAFPCCAEPATLPEALQALREDSVTRGRDLSFCLLSAEQCDLLRTLLPGPWEVLSDRGDADYLYKREELALLPGTAFHNKRNHISQFERTYPGEINFHSLSEVPAQDVLNVAEEWLAAQESSPDLLHEARAIRNALKHIHELQLFGGVLYVREKPVGMAVGSMISPSVADIHYEKCIPTYRAAYPLLTRETARLLPSSCQFINREEDLNQPGLRQSKLSFHPCEILEKFRARRLRQTHP